jgi:dihydroflavonol-4-reductase
MNTRAEPATAGIDKVLITGANGFLATNTIIELLNHGFYVIGLLRDRKKFILPAQTNLELIEGDILDIDFIETIIQKCDYILHVASETRQSLTKYSDYYRINVEGTEKLIRLAVKYRIKKFVYVSTAGTIGFGTKECPGDENNKIKKPFSESYYMISKLAAQDIVLANTGEVDSVVVNPSFLIGPYDQKPSSGRIILLGFNRRIIFYPPGGKNFIHVFDVAKGIVSAMLKGKNGEKYLLANENMSFKEFYQKLSGISGTRSLLIKIPKFVLMLIGYFGNILRAAGIRNDLILTNMKMLCVNNYFSGFKAQNELDIEFNTIDVALNDAVSWFKENDMIK